MSNTAKQVVVALDGSENSLRALKVGSDLAQAMGRDLGVVYVYPNTIKGPSAAISGLPDIPVDKLEKHKSRSATEVFDAAVAKLGSSHPPIHKHLLVGDPAEEIIGFMEEHPGTHLVMGRRGLSRIKALVIGSVSDKVTRHASGMVTVVS